MQTIPDKLKIRFGRPQHDWLLVEFEAGEFQLAFKASGVLDDPLAELIGCLSLVTQGVDAAMSWWLEPEEYWFHFSLVPGQTIRLLIEERGVLGTKRQLFSQTASYEHIILPFWRALRGLNSADFDGENWYPLPLEKLQKLTQLVQGRRARD